MAQRKMILGCGYLGSRIAHKWRNDGHLVYALTRSERRAEKLASEGFRPLIGDVADPDFQLAAPADSPLDTVVCAIGFDRSSGASFRDVYVDGLRRILDRLPPTVGRLIYISSTGVYGQSDGQWVDETSLCEPIREGGLACLEAERLLASHPLGERSVVLRLAGIYGPNRLPRRHLIERGEPLPSVPDGVVNLIHVDDAVRVALAAEERAKPPRLYVVSDSQPVVRREFYRQMAEALGAPAPRFRSPAPGSPTARRSDSNKRICSRRVLEELSIRLDYPSYKEGLAALFGASR